MGNKTAFISGATSGIGAAFANYYASKGYDLIITGHPKDEVNLPINRLKKLYNVNIELILIDLSIEDNITSLVGELRNNKRIEVIINNAGYLNKIPFIYNDIDDVDNMINLHIIAPVRIIHALLPNMITKNKGIIINLASLAAYTPFPDYVVYPATKLFNIGFTESLHITLQSTQIKVQVLCPGFVHSNFHNRAGFNLSDYKNKKLMHWMKPEKVVEISIRNLQKKNKVIVIPGFWNKLAKLAHDIMPNRLYYLLSHRFLN